MDLKTLEATPPWDWPESAAQLILDVLSAKQACEDDRVLAVTLAGESTVVNEAIADELLAIISDPGETTALRAKAAISLGPAIEFVDTMGSSDSAFEDPDAPLSDAKYEEVQNLLASVVADGDEPDDLRRAALEASVRGPLPWHEDAIRKAYASTDPKWQETAVFCMQFVQGFDGRILAALNSDDAGLQYHGAMAAGVWEIDAAWDRLCELLEKSEDTSLRLAAMEAIANVRPDEAELLISQLARGDEESTFASQLISELQGPSTGSMAIPDELLN